MAVLEGGNDNDADGGGGNGNGGRGSATTREAEVMRRAAKMMEEHRRSQEVSERAAAMMDKLSLSRLWGGARPVRAGGGILGCGGRRRKEGRGQGDLQRPPAFGGGGRGLEVPVLVVIQL